MTDFPTAMAALEGASDFPGAYVAPFLDVLPVTGAAVSTLGELLGSETLIASDQRAARLDELQFDLGEGPCWDAVRLGRPVLETDVRHSGRWPAFSTAITAEDVSSIFAFPLAVGSLRFGAIDLYSTAPVRLDETQARQAGAMAAVVGRHVLRRALADIGAEEIPTGYSRRIVHQATGVVLAQLDISPDDALSLIHI